MSAADRFNEADRKAAEAAEAEAMDVDDFYDSERIEINRLMTTLMENIGKHREMGAFQREVRERFAEIGFVVRCDFYQDMAEDGKDDSERVNVPSITILGRCEKVGEFDHDQMGHEVRSNILGKKDQDSVQRVQVGQTGFSKTRSGLIVPGSN